MICFTVLCNGIFAALIVAVYVFGGKTTLASLDVDNESTIQESISKLIENKTVLIIAHRMRTVDGVDKIVVLKDGVVVEQGTPQELKSKDSIYRHMIETQLETERWKYQ